MIKIAMINQGDSGIRTEKQKEFISNWPINPITGQRENLVISTN